MQPAMPDQRDSGVGWSGPIAEFARVTRFSEGRRLALFPEDAQGPLHSQSPAWSREGHGSVKASDPQSRPTRPRVGFRRSRFRRDRGGRTGHGSCGLPHAR